jgi:hypothetical protein
MNKHLLGKYIVNLNDGTKIPTLPKWNVPPFNTFILNTNYSILTGSINNITVVDIDLLENKTAINHYWTTLINIHGKPKTLTVRTPSGGLHYYFKYEKDIKTTINLKVGDDNTCIDIINESKDGKPLNIVGPNSVIGDTKYEIIKDRSIKTMPQWLKDHIINNQTANTNNHINKIYESKNILTELNRIYSIPNKELNDILYKLDNTWFNDYKKWSIVTNILKGLNQQDIWDKWSSQSPKYNKQNNINYWNNDIPKFDINLLLNELDIKTIPHTFRYIPITDIKNIDVSEQNERYINLSKVVNIGWLKKCIIIKSDTGTGKTTSTFNMFKKNDYKYILSIVTRRSLVNQHIENAKKVKLDMYSYEDPKVNKKNIVCYQLDSIMKFLTDKRRGEIKNYVVYMDEINSTLKYLINSSTMERKRIDLFHTLNYIIRNAHLIICSDADISDIVFKYIAEFRTINECVFVNNIFKNYNNINAFKYNDVNKLLSVIKNRIKNNEGFIACFDQLKFLDQVYYNLYDEDKKHLYIKITSKDDDFTNTEIWKNKFVFYSPKIIYGNDFVPDTKTDIFVFSKGGSIDSLQIVQQATRCRKINNLYYYIKVKPQYLKYKDIDDCKNIINNEKKIHYQILKELNCVEYDEEARTSIKMNICTEMYIYNEMVDDLLKSNYLFHFEEIIKKKGFIINECDGDHVLLDKESTEYAKQCSAKKLEDIKKCYLDNTIQYKYKQYYELIKNRAEILNLNKEQEIAMIDLLIDDKQFETHLITSKLFRTVGAINDEFKGEITEKQIKSVYSKLILLEYIESIMNIKRFEFNDTILKDNYIEWTAEHHNKYKNLFKNRSKYDNSHKELYKIRTIIYKSFNKDLIAKDRKSVNGVRKVNTLLNEAEVKKHLDIFLLRQSKNLHNVNDNIIKQYDLSNNEDAFIDD